MPPRLPSGAQSPARSAGFDLAGGFGGAALRAGACALTTSENVTTPSDSVARNINRLRMGELLTLVVYFAAGAGAGGPFANSSLPSGNTIFWRFPTFAPFLAAKTYTVTSSPSFKDR